MEQKTSKTKLIIYWTSTVLLIFFLLSGGIAHLLQMDFQAEGMIRLGYPLYFMSILGAWKILGAIAITIPGFALIKEWAYAGIFFNMTGASISHAVMQDEVGHILWPLIIACLAVTSWALRPPSRKLDIVHT